MVAKPVFKAKWKHLLINHTGVLQPFPGRNKTRWTVVEPQVKQSCHYEGKPSTQALEMVLKLRRDIIYLMEFDRAGVFFVQIFTYGTAGAYDYQIAPTIWKHYRGDNIIPARYFAQFKRP